MFVWRTGCDFTSAGPKLIREFTKSKLPLYHSRSMIPTLEDTHNSLFTFHTIDIDQYGFFITSLRQVLTAIANDRQKANRRARLQVECSSLVPLLPFAWRRINRSSSLLPFLAFGPSYCTAVSEIQQN